MIKIHLKCTKICIVTHVLNTNAKRSHKSMFSDCNKIQNMQLKIQNDQNSHRICINIQVLKNTVTNTKRSHKAMFSGCLLSTDATVCLGPQLLPIIRPGKPCRFNFSFRVNQKDFAHSLGGQFNPFTCMPMSLTMTLFGSTNSILLQLA